MSLLREIQNDLATAGGDITNVLRKCKILAARLGSDELTRWVDFELDGFPESQPIPEYRRLRINCYASFMNHAWRVNQQIVPVIAVPEKFRGALYKPVEFRDGLTVAMTFVDKGAMIEDPHLSMLIQSHGVMFRTLQCVKAWKEISGTEFQQPSVR